LIALLVAVLATAVVAVLFGAGLSLRRSARELALLVEELEGHLKALIGQAEETIGAARSELARVDELVGSAEAITATVGSASRVVHAVLAAPLIKVVAFASGTLRAGRSLRRRA